jgi:hypothetical protein
LAKGGTTLADRIDSGYNPTDFDAMREDRFWQAAEIGFGGLLKEILARNVIPSVNEPEGEMRGQEQSSSSLFGYVDIEGQVPATHPLWLSREIPGATTRIPQSTNDTGPCGPRGRRRWARS